MGKIRFFAPTADRLSPSAAEQAYLAGIEGIPWPCRNTLHNGLLTIERDVAESGNLYIPWTIDHDPPLVLSTASLMERDEPYLLPLELARGTLHRVRNYKAELEQAGYLFSPELAETLRSATQHFVAAVTDSEDLEAACDQVIAASLEAIQALVHELAQQALAARKKRGKLATLLAARLEGELLPDNVATTFSQTVNAAAVSICWRDVQTQENQFDWTAVDRHVEWCRRNKLRICAGPLVRLDSAHLPDWVYLWEDDFGQLQECIVRFVEAAVRRYADRVQLWHCASSLNINAGISLSEEDRLRLAVTAVETVRRTDGRTPLVISFDQPWAEYLAREDMDLSPLHFADALARADMGISGFGLDINLGYWPGGTQARDVLEVNRQIDRWSMLGLPLLVLLTMPSTAGPDPLARYGESLPEASGDALLTAKQQQQTLDQLLPLLISKPAVHGLIWNQLSDATAHAFPHGGLFDAQWQAKPIQSIFSQLRRQHFT